MAEGFITRRLTRVEATSYIDASAVAFVDTYLSFDGVNDYVDLNSPLLPQTGDFTVDMLVDIKSFDTQAPLLTQYVPSISDRFIIGVGTSNQLSVLGNGSADLLTFPSIGKYRITVTKSGSSYNAYVNYNQITGNTTFTSSIYQGDNTEIGGDPNWGQYLAVDYYELRIYNRVLSNNEIQTLYNFGEVNSGLIAKYDFQEGSGTTLNDSAGNNDGTINGATWQDQSVETLTYQDGSKFYKSHTFRSSGTFTVNSLGTVNNELEYLVVSGGGGGGGRFGGGGGAGGYKDLTFTPTISSYTVTIGAGGAEQPSENRGNQGSSSSVFSVSTTGGGGGGSLFSEQIGGNGGSGGGGSLSNSGGSGISGEGFAGASGNSGAGVAGGGGGGGASETGTASNSSSGGFGGDGKDWKSLGVYYAGGGGGVTENSGGTQGLGGLGGGGRGWQSGSSSTAGEINTGGGGGGGKNDGGDNGKAGGSGIVIIRYEVGGL